MQAGVPTLCVPMRTLLIPAVFGLILLTIAIVARSGKLAREDPGTPISTGMREAMGMMTLPPEQEAAINQLFPDAEITRTGLRYVIVRPGTEGTAPQRGQIATIHYRGTFIDGSPLDDSYSKDTPYSFEAGKAQVVPGLDQAILEMNVGEQRNLVIPYWLGYGEKGVKGKIPEKATLLFTVELLGVE